MDPIFSIPRARYKDAAPVGVRGEKGGLHERRGADSAADGAGLHKGTGTSHGDSDKLGRT